MTIKKSLFLKLAISLFLVLQANALCASELDLRISARTSLPESILRETYSAIDRTREMLVARQSESGDWVLANSVHTILPAIALLDNSETTMSDSLKSAQNISLRFLEERINKPWTNDDAVEVAISYVLISSLVGVNNIDKIDKLLNDRIHDRLSRVQLRGMPKQQAVLILSALSMFPDNTKTPEPNKWTVAALPDNIANAEAQLSVEDVAIAAYARMMMRKTTNSPDVLAYIRWLVEKLDLHRDSATDNIAPLTPVSAYYAAQVFSMIPRKLIMEDPSLCPIDWRNRFASRLISQQKRDSKTGHDYWDASKTRSSLSDSALYDTTYSIMTLVILSKQ